MTELTKLNGFEINEHGVYCVASDASRSFGYSDGQSTEAYLDQVLSEANDLSVSSKELHSSIKDWPSEYHLTGLRSNLLKPLNLDGVNRVLELGCGCGAISRYLGEQGIEVDAVEGSPVRAALAKKRCSDLANVTVSTANFNELVLPDQHYDAVLYIGVTEYAGRFSDAPSDQEAVISMLQNARGSLSDKGVVVIAIENRLGMKYLIGADEDHYGKPYVGVENYPDDEGMRTYSYNEWKGLLEDSSLPFSQFLLPFPDYKVPTMLVAESGLPDHQDEASAFTDIRSMDYTSDFSVGEVEPYIWRGLTQGDSLAQFANSYLIIASKTENSSKQLAVVDNDLLEDYRSLYPNNDYTSYLKQKGQAVLKHGWPTQQRLNDSENRITVLQEELAQARERMQSMTSSRVWRLLTTFDRLLKKLGLKQR